ncbi:MAG TPA: hypothetical protein VJ826_09395 [Candidatus Polarisedimenticolaceae bacterium]|nr:hypothetical protein [Candidatus Polarisedimenticolaceae bacterium]
MRKILFAALALALITEAKAGMDVAFGARVPIGDDGSLFVNISSRYFERDPSVIQSWGRRFESPDDLAVFFWITETSRKNADFVFALRRQGLPWFEVATRCGVPVDAWYVKVPVDPGPPYGKAYGHWRKHQRDPEYRVKLTDRQTRDLVAVRFCHEYYRVPVETAMDWRRNGEDVRMITTRQYKERHGKHGRDRDDDDQGHHGGNAQGRGNGHGRGASKH